MGLYKQPNSEIWYVRFKLRGKVYRLSTGTTRRRDADRIATRLRADIESQCAPPEPEPEPELVDVGATPPAAAAEPATESCTPATTLADLARFDTARAAATGVTAAQQQSIELCWRHLCDTLGADTTVAAITYDVVEDYLRRRRQTGARGQSLRKERQALARGLKIARRRGLIDTVLDDWPTIRNDPPKPEQQASCTHRRSSPTGSACSRPTSAPRERGPRPSSPSSPDFEPRSSAGSPRAGSSPQTPTLPFLLT